MAAHNDCVLLPVTAVIYRNGQETAAMRWFFEAAIGRESDKNLFNLISRIREGFGIADRCSQLQITKFAVIVSMKDFKATANCPKGRIFEIDSQEQWDVAIAKVIEKERELIGWLSYQILSIFSLRIFYCNTVI